MFNKITRFIYQGKFEREYIWQAEGEPSYIMGTVLGNKIIRLQASRKRPTPAIRYNLTDGGPDTLPYHSWSVCKGDEQWPDTIGEDQARSLLEPLLQNFTFSQDSISLIRSLTSDERIYGLGERTGPMNKRGQAFPIWNIDPPQHHTAETKTMYTSIPFYLGYDLTEQRANGVLIDHTGKVEMDLGQSIPDKAISTVQGDQMVIYLFQASTPAEIVQDYTELTGRTPLPPRWALGHHQARWSYPSAEEVRRIAKNLRERNHPNDAIWLDIDYMNGYRNFTWNSETFPDPVGLINELHQQGLHLVTIVDPGTKVDPAYSIYQQGVQKDFFCKNPDGSLFIGPVWPGDCHFPDFSRSEVRKWWGDLYQGLLEQGVDGVWNDMDEPALTTLLVDPTEAPENPEVAKEVAETEKVEDPKTMPETVLHQAGGTNPTGPDGEPTTHKFFHNAYGMEMARSTREGLQRLRPDQRPFVLTRSGTAGMQRYAALWTGDNTSEWTHIPLAIRMCLNLGISGVSFVGVDIGGFWKDSNGELLVRFAQLGTLLPFCRNHNEISSRAQEPWVFGEPYESAYRTAIETRYRLLPYLYTLFQETNRTGAPIVRPLYYHFAGDKHAFDENNEFLLGSDLLSAPITEEGAIAREVYLPEGSWFDFWNGKVYAGASTRRIEAPLDRWPLLVRANSIIPTAPLMQYVDQQATDPLTITCYMANDGQASYTLYEDDGSSLAYQRGQYAETIINCQVSGQNVTLELEERYNGYRPQRTAYELIVHLGDRTLTRRLEAGKGKQVIQL